MCKDFLFDTILYVHHKFTPKQINETLLLLFWTSKVTLQHNVIVSKTYLTQAFGKQRIKYFQVAGD